MLFLFTALHPCLQDRGIAVISDTHFAHCSRLITRLCVRARRRRRLPAAANTSLRPMCAVCTAPAVRACAALLTTTLVVICDLYRVETEIAQRMLFHHNDRHIHNVSFDHRCVYQLKA